MIPMHHWIPRTTDCARHWREPRWRLQLLAAPRSWLHASLPRVVPAAVAVSTVVVTAVSVGGAHLPGSHGA